MKRVAPLFQESGSDCGTACLASVLSFHSPGSDPYKIKQQLAQSSRGSTLAHLAVQARSHNLVARGLNCPTAMLHQITLPAIAHWGADHFVVIEGVSDRFVQIMDPRRGSLTLPRDEFEQFYSETVLELIRGAGFRPFERAKKPSALRLMRSLHGIRGRLLPIFALGLVVEFSVALYPVLLQTAVDTAVPANDWRLLGVLAVILAALTLLQSALSYSRGVLTARLAGAVSFQLSASTFWAILRSPTQYFALRSPGEMLTKFSSIDAIRNVVALTTVGLVLDVLFVAIGLALLSVYSIAVALATIFTISLFVVSRYISQAAINDRASQAISASAKQNSFLLESVQAVTTIRLLGIEHNRQVEHQKNVGSVLHHEIAVGNIQAKALALQNALFGVDNIVFLAICVGLLASNSLTLGALFAALTYKAMLNGRVASAVEKAMQFNGLAIHIRRLEDLPDQNTNSDAHLATANSRSHGLNLVFDSVSYRYSPDDPDVVEGFSLRMEAGEHVCLVAPSGAGKTTLLNIASGLLLPNEGRVLVDGIELREENHQQFWKSVSIVRQSDSLLEGTIAENVSSFDENCNEQQIANALAQASFIGEVVAMPMGLYTRIGALGEGLSGGQKQRLLLARAFYRRPKLLILDEATSHLDRVNEQVIVSNVRKMGCTVLMAAHRQETIRSADRVVDLVDSTEDSKPPIQRNAVLPVAAV